MTTRSTPPKPATPAAPAPPGRLRFLAGGPYNCDPLDDVLGLIEEQVDNRDQTLSNLGRPEGDLIAVVTLHGVVGNGGFKYWYERTTVKRTRRCAAAFRRIGAPDVADAILETLTLAPLGRSRQPLTDAEHDRLVKTFKPFDDLMRDCDHQLLSARYAVAHRAELIQRTPRMKQPLREVERWLASPFVVPPPFTPPPLP